MTETRRNRSSRVRIFDADGAACGAPFVSALPVNRVQIRPPRIDDTEHERLRAVQPQIPGALQRRSAAREIEQDREISTLELAQGRADIFRQITDSLADDSARSVSGRSPVGQSR